jgi:hypothetical protein
MHTTGMSFKASGRQMGNHYNVVSRLVRKHTQTNNSQCCLSTGLVVNGIRLTKRCNALSSRSDITRGLPDLGKSLTTAYTSRSIQPTVPYGGGSVMVWGVSLMTASWI